MSALPLRTSTFAPVLKYTMKKYFLAFGISTVLLASSPSTWAAPVDLRTFAPLGNTLVKSASAKLTTAFTDEDPPPGSTGSALDINDLEPRLMVIAGTLGGNAYEGSALQQTFTASENTNVSFNWTLSTNNFDANFVDFAFALIDNRLVVPLAYAASTEVAGLFNYLYGAGTHTLAFGVVDIGDYVGVSTLTVSELNFTSNAVAEPGTWTLLLAGLGISCVFARRRRGATPTHSGVKKWQRRHQPPLWPASTARSFS